MQPGLWSPYVVFLFCCLAVVVAVTVLVWRQRPRTGTTELTALLCATLVWGGIYAFGLLTHDEPTRLLVERVMWVGVATAPVAWVVFGLPYSGRRRLDSTLPSHGPGAGGHPPVVFIAMGP